MTFSVHCDSAAFAPLSGRSYGAPRSIQAAICSIAAAGSLSASCGMYGFFSCAISLHSRLSPDRLATTTAPLSPPLSSPSRSVISKSRLDRLAAVALEAVLEQHRPHVVLEQLKPLGHLRRMIGIDRLGGGCGVRREKRGGNRQQSQKDFMAR